MEETPKTEEPKEPRIYHMKGSFGYEIEIEEDQFRYRGQVSSENNLANLIAIRELYSSIIKAQKSPILKKENKISKQEMEMIHTAHRITAMHAERLAASLFKMAIEKDLQPDKPKIEVVQPLSNLRSV